MNISLITWLVCLLLGSDGALAAKLSDVRGTVHNLAHPDNTVNFSLSSGPLPTRSVMATSTEPGFCVFCHTVHSSSPASPPMWNKDFSVETYVPYSSSSLDALSDMSITQLGQPDDNSKLCLSCHDGTLAVGTVAVFNGGPSSIELIGTRADGSMPGSAASPDDSGITGYTRRLGGDLRNDHPISVNYTMSLARRDGELRDVDSNQRSYDSDVTIGPRSDGGNHKLPLFGAVGTAQVQCPTCHDPHIRDDNPLVGNQKFLRLNRFQEAQPTSLFSAANDIVCLGCHEKGGESWAYSAHANEQVAEQTYYSGPGGLREFPDDLPVWKASCLNCHDTHTVEGARYLLREGTDGTASPLGKVGGDPASEETCFQCHSGATSIVTNMPHSVPDIKSDYNLDFHMPLTTSHQPASPPEEVHDIGGNFNESGLPEGGVNCSSVDNTCGADFVEQRSKLGVGNLNNRHAECSDCHNPHRVVKFRDFRGNPIGTLMGLPDPAGTHMHDEPGYIHTNIASGVLRGMTGVEPVYSGNSFEEMPNSFTVKRGDPGNSIDADALTAPHVTFEYQVCLKCHSNYGYSDNNEHSDLTGNRPSLGVSGGSTPSSTNGLTQYTNQAKEFQAPVSHRGEVTTTDSGASSTYVTNNHRSWHPVMGMTGRTPIIRGDLDPNTFLSPWNEVDAVGAQTMYCSDCHGSETGLTTVEPAGGDNGSSWGPHGSNNPFLLKGQWGDVVGEDNSDALCFRCHDYNQYANPATPPAGKMRSGFSGLASAAAPDNDINLHVQHAAVMNSPATPMRCSQCHEAVSHGWKNKALLVNLNDVGPEAGLPVGTVIPDTSLPYTKQPYYLGARLKVNSFATSGEWKKADCGGCHS